jgi:hypothetical protein
MKKIALLGIFALIFTFFACVKSETETVNLTDGFAYYPLKVGKYKVFQVDSILYDDLGNGKVKIDSFRLYQKEVVRDTFVNLLGETVFHIDRYEKRDLKAPWILKDVVSAERNQTQGIRVDNGQRFVKMVYPMRRRQNWNSLIYIDTEVRIIVATESIEIFRNWNSEVFEVNKPDLINNRKYGKVLTIRHANYEKNLLEYRKMTEKYVRDTGLVATEATYFDTQNTSSTETWRKKAQKGFIFKQYLIENN